MKSTAPVCDNSCKMIFSHYFHIFMKQTLNIFLFQIIIIIISNKSMKEIVSLNFLHDIKTDTHKKNNIPEHILTYKRTYLNIYTRSNS